MAGPGKVGVPGVLRELPLLGFALGAYYGVRLLVRSSGIAPLNNAADLLRFESVLHLDWEMAVQRVFLGHLQPVVHLLNFVYAWGYWLILAGSLSYLYARQRNAYRSLRNSLIISGLIGCFIFASFPVAPPRLTTMGIVDTVQLSSSLLEEVARPGAVTNENAAMPSFHFGWVLLCGVCLSMAVRRRVSKMLTLSLPLLMGLTIIVTGNHYVVDAVAGGALSLCALAPWALPRRAPLPAEQEVQPV